MATIHEFGCFPAFLQLQMQKPKKKSLRLIISHIVRVPPALQFLCPPPTDMPCPLARNRYCENGEINPISSCRHRMHVVQKTVIG